MRCIYMRLTRNWGQILDLFERVYKTRGDSVGQTEKCRLQKADQGLSASPDGGILRRDKDKVDEAKNNRF